MNILIVSQYFYPEDFRINDICKGLKEKGHNVEILTGIPNYPEGKMYKEYSMFNKKFNSYEEMKIYRSLMITRGKNSSLRLSLNYLSFMIMATLRGMTLLRKKYDKIFVFQVSPITSAVPALIMGKFKKIPTYIYIQDLWPETFYSIVNINNNNIKKFLKKICIKIYNGFDNILIASRGYRDILDKYIDNKKITYVPQWAEDFYLNDEFFESNEFNVTFAGNIGKAQNVETIVNAAKLDKNSNIKWNIKKLVKENNLEDKVILHGRKPSSEMPKYFSSSDGLIVTLKNEDILKVTLPAKVQSYMAAGKPIIGCLSGEGNKIIKEIGCGLVSEAEDYRGLYENVCKLYNMSKEERVAMGVKGREFFKNNFTRTKLLDELERILNAN